MISINNISYSLENLKSVCSEKFWDNNLSDWETTFWMFIATWFDEKKDEIEIKTSGSTSKPKTIFHKKEFMKASAITTCNYFKLDKNKTALLCLPLNTIGGIMMLVRSLLTDMNLIIEKPSSNPLKNLSQKIDFIAMVPFQVQKTIAESPEKLKLIDTIIIGGGKVSDNLKKEIIHLKINAFSTFGMTETISHIALKKIGNQAFFEALGKTSFEIDKENCLIINAKHLGIENLKTNDIIELISKNKFVWLGRKDNAIETGGVKIIPELVEKKIEQLIASRFFISSIPDKMLNNKIILLVENKRGSFNIELMISKLNKFEYPKEIYYLERFIEAKNNKINRTATLNLLIKQLNTKNF